MGDAKSAKEVKKKAHERERVRIARSRRVFLRCAMVARRVLFYSMRRLTFLDLRLEVHLAQRESRFLCTQIKDFAKGRARL